MNNLQEVIFNNDRIPTRVEGKKVYVGIKQVCLNIGLTVKQADRQIANIQEDEILNIHHLKFGVVEQMAKNTITRQVSMMDIEVLHLWLAKIRITPTMKKNNPKTVERLIKYQLECAKVLREHFAPDMDKLIKIAVEQAVTKAVSEAIDPLQKQIDSYFKPYENPIFEFERLLLMYTAFKNLDERSRYSILYNDLSNYYLLDIPKAKNTKNWLIVNLGIDKIRHFVEEYCKGSIIKCPSNALIHQGVISKYEWEKLLDIYDYKCAYCRTHSDNLIQEHIIPKRHEGSSDEISNIVPACPSCNKKKNELSLEEFCKQYSINPFIQFRIKQQSKHFKH